MNEYSLLMFAIICGMIGAFIGQSRKCGVTGFIAGLFLGPLGWLLVLFNDQRRQCSECKGRIPDDASRCQHCGVVFEKPKPLPTPPPPENILETYKEWKEKNPDKELPPHLMSDPVLDYKRWKEEKGVE
jgi:hypothetical protein